VVPRQFLRQFIRQMDLIDENSDYDPLTEYGFHPDQLSPEEQHILTGAPLVDFDENSAELIPREDVW
jgi:hypothetical protein